MANIENLKKGKATQFQTGEEQVKIARKGGIASGEARREKKLIKDRILERMGEGDWDTMIDNLISRAMEQSITRGWTMITKVFPFTCATFRM